MTVSLAVATKTTEDINDAIVRFLGEEMARADRYQLERIELVYGPRDFRPETLKTWTRAETPDLFSSLTYVTNIAAECVERAEKYADDTGPGAYRMIVRTFQAGGGRQTMTFTAIPSSAGGAVDALSGPLEASATGVLAQQMRQNEFLTRQMQGMLQGTIGSLTRQLVESQDECKALREERAQLWRDRETNRNAEAARELEIVQAGRSNDRKDLIVGNAVKLLPIALAGALGNKVTQGPAAESMLASIVATLGGSLVEDPARVQQIMAVLSLQERALFGEAMRIARMATATPSSGQAPAGNAGNPADAAPPPGDQPVKEG